MFKIGSLAVLLGIFGLVGSSVSAANTCNKANTPNDGNSHSFTCQKKVAKTNFCEANFTDSWSDRGCAVWYSCHRCIPSAVVPPTCTATEKLNTSTNTCDPIPAATTTTTTAPGNAVVCKEWYIPNPDLKGTPCIPKPATPAATKTPQEECEARGDWQWNNSLDKTDKCEQCSATGVCCGVELNTDVPFVGKCIRLWSSASSEDTTVVTDATAFPRLMWGLTKILTTLILLACFGGILAGGVMIASSGGKETNATKGKELIKNVVIAMALLWTSGIILKLINPNFFW